MKTTIFVGIILFITGSILTIISRLSSYEPEQTYYKSLTTAQLDSIQTEELKQHKQDSLQKIEDAIAERKAERKFMRSRAGQVYKFGKRKGMEWDRDDCQLVADNKIWIGMNYWMLVYLRGNPDRINPSDYGHGIRYQYCWDDYTPSHFYDDNDDNVIDSYN